MYSTNFPPSSDPSLIISGAREISALGIAGGAGAGVDPRKRVEQLEGELARMHRNYEHLVGLHKGLWERQAKWMIEIGVGSEDSKGKEKGNDEMEEEQ